MTGLTSELSPPARKSAVIKWINKNKTGFLFILPALILYLIFFISPFITSIYYSLTDWDGVSPVKGICGPAKLCPHSPG